MRVPPNHPKLDHFSIETYEPMVTWGNPILGNLHVIYVISTYSVYIYIYICIIIYIYISVQHIHTTYIHILSICMYMYIYM